MQEYFEVGQIVNTFGIKGEVKIKPFTDDLERFEELESVYIIKNNQYVDTKIESVKFQKFTVVIKFEGINDMDQAEALKGCYLKIDREDARPLKQGSYYIADLIGFKVYTEEDKLLGILEEIYNPGANDIYVVRDENDKQILLPGIKDVIKKVDLEQAKIIVHLLKGLVEE